MIGFVEEFLISEVEGLLLVNLLFDYVWIDYFGNVKLLGSLLISLLVVMNFCCDFDGLEINCMKNSYVFDVYELFFEVVLLCIRG